MADRYWVGGTATWDATAGTKWSTTNGGAGGASVPTASDDVFFTASSGNITCTVSGARVAQSINCTGFTGVLSGTGSLTLSGSLTLVAGMTMSSTIDITFNGTGTITSAGKQLRNINVNSAGITVTLGGALNLGTTGTLTVFSGTFTTSASNYSITASAISSSGTNARTINLNNSTVTLSSATPLNFFDRTNLTFNADTSSIVCSASFGVTFDGAGLTYYNVSFTGSNMSSHSISGTNTFNNLSITGLSSAGTCLINLSASQTINGILSTTGTAGNRRILFVPSGVSASLRYTLTINSSPSLTDVDFKDIIVIGTAAPISGTRIGNLGNCTGITFSTPKTVYWVVVGALTWNGNAWSNTSNGGQSTDFYPLAQDTATFTNSVAVTTVTIGSSVQYIGSIDMSPRTGAMTISVTSPTTVYGNWKNGSGTTISGTNTLTFSGDTTKTITSAGKTFTCPIIVDNYIGSVELADAFNIGSTTLTVTNGTFDTKNFNVTAGALSSNSSNVRAIKLGSSTVTLTGSINPINFSTSTNLTFNAGTSQINCGLNGTFNFQGGGQTFYNVACTFAQTSASIITFEQVNTFTNLTFTAPASAGLQVVSLTANQTITGTLTVAGATAVRRIFVRSSTLGTQRTLSVGTLSATDCDFRDIAITGTAAGSSPTRAGDCGGNSGITFPAAKTVYWRSAADSNWSDPVWAPSSGGSPNINNFPLAQDTAVLTEADPIKSITIEANWNIGTFDGSGRNATAWQFNVAVGAAPVVYGNWKTSPAVTHNLTGSTITFSKRGTQTITSSGITFNCNIEINSATGTVQLADAISTNSTRSFTLTSGTFDAVSYNVSPGTFLVSGSTTRTLKMGSGTWTLSSATASVVQWNAATTTNLTFYKGTANIVVGNNSSNDRTFAGGGLSYNKLTFAGSGTYTATITGDNQFTELASTKTIAFTIALGTTIQTFGKWTVTGTSNNVVTLTGTGTSHSLAGACTSGIDWLAMGSIGFAATSPGEFYAGANSTGTAGAPVYRTSRPLDSTRYWVGGTGNWSDTARWSTTSGGASGAAVPRSHDDVVFDNLSSATAYTATVNAVTGGVRVKALTITGPASGNVTLAGTTRINIHGNVTLPATGMTRTHTGGLVLSGSTTGLMFTTNGVAWTASGANVIEVNGVDCGWTLGSAADLGTNSGLLVFNGSFSTANYPLSAAYIHSQGTNKRTLNLGSSIVTLSGFNNPVNFGTTESIRADLTFSAGTSQINIGISTPTIDGNNQTFYNVALTSTSAGTVTINGTNSFNNLSFTGITSAGLKDIVLTANQTVAGTLTFSAGTNATMRHFFRSNSNVFPCTITAAAVSMTDVDFRDITIAGAAAPASGTRIGDCKNNSGITFTPAANKYWNLLGGGVWSNTGWATTSGGSASANNFPLAQDTCFFEATGLISGGNVTIDQNYNIGTINMSARTANTMTLATGTTTPTIYGNWINGTGTTLTGTGIMTFAGRSSQTITSAGRTFTQRFNISVREGSVALADSLTISNSSGGITLESGTLDAVVYNVTFSNGGEMQASSGSATRVVAIGSGTWTTNSTSAAAWNTGGTNVTITGTGTISLTGGSFKTFTGGGKDYSGITLNQGGQGQLTITGNNTFKDITNTYKTTGATTINMGATTQRVSQFTAAGESGRLLTLTGTSASSPGTLILTGAGTVSSDFLSLIGVRAYPLTDKWYAGTNSTNGGTLGWTFSVAPVILPSNGNFLMFI